MIKLCHIQTESHTLIHFIGFMKPATNPYEIKAHVKFSMNPVGNTIQIYENKFLSNNRFFYNEYVTYLVIQ